MTDEEKIRQLLDRGLTAYGLGNVDEAVEAWRNVLSLDPGNSKAREYIRFVEESWGPRQERLGMPYRPDEGSGEIPKIEDLAAKISSEEPASEASPEEEPVSDIDISVDVPPDEGGFETGAFTPPAKPIVQGDQWGDLYDFSGQRPESAQKPAELPPPAPPVEEPPTEEPTPEPAKEQEKIVPLAGDWSDVLTKEERTTSQVEKTSSTLPPHPGETQPEVQPMPIIELEEEVAPDEQPDTQVVVEPEELEPTKRYESVPTMVRPSKEVVVPPKQEEGLARDSFDRFPVDPEPPIEPEPLVLDLDLELEPEPESGKAFYQVPRGEPTPPLGSPMVKPDDSDLLDLVAGEQGSAVEAGAVPGISAASEVDSLLKGVRDMLELDDFTGALELLDKVLEREPKHSEAQKMHTEAERELLSMLSSKLGDLDRTPRVRMSPDEIIWLNLDNRAGFVLSLVDGSLSLDEIISICGLPQLEGMRILVQLLQEKVIEIG